MENKKPDDLSLRQPGRPSYGGPAAFRLPITRDLALSRDNRKSPQKGSPGSPEGFILWFWQIRIHSVSSESKFYKHRISKHPEKNYSKNVSMSIKSPTKRHITYKN
jgi:hypothetical protein